MINAIKEWSLHLAGIIIFGSVCEMILPSGSIKKYVNIVLGIILILAMTQPLSRLLGFNPSEIVDEIDRHNAYVSHSQMDDIQKEQIINLYCKNLNTDIEKTIQNVNENRSITVKTEVEQDNIESFGEISCINIEAEITGDEEKEQILKIIRERYGVDKKKVRFK